MASPERLTISEFQILSDHNAIIIWKFSLDFQNTSEDDYTLTYILISKPYQNLLRKVFGVSRAVSHGLSTACAYTLAEKSMKVLTSKKNKKNLRI